MTDRIWQDMLDAARLSSYYRRLATRFRRRHFATNVVISVLSLMAATVLLVDLPDWISASLFLAVAIVVVWGSYSDYSKRATIARHVSRRCNQIATEFRQLWYDEDTEINREQVANLERELDIATDVELDIDDRLNTKVQEEIYHVYERESEIHGSGKATS